MHRIDEKRPSNISLKCDFSQNFSCFSQNQVFDTKLHCDTDNLPLIWSDRAEIFTRGGHDASSGVFSVVFNVDLSVESLKDFRVNN